MGFRLTSTALLALLLAGCNEPAAPTASPPGGSVNAAPLDTDATPRHAAGWPRPAPPIRATHWFGEHWAPNLINAYRREDVAAQFATIRDDGFDTVILVVSWADFQPVFAPCCTHDERAFERLRFLVDEAERQQLRVMLRIGYSWGFHPASPPTLKRIHRLMNESATRAAFHQFVDRIAGDIEGRGHVSMSFMSWEDQWLHDVEPSAAADYARFVASLPADQRPADPTRLPRADDDSAVLFHRYWDWLAMAELHAPAQQRVPNLGYEVRIDKEPLWHTAPDGTRTVAQWIDHRAMYRQAGDAPLVLYWAPYWGAQNVGERLQAPQSLALLSGMLDEARQWSGGRPAFIGQFNLIDNTPGHEHNAALPDDQIAPFLRGAVCVLKEQSVLGVGLWTGRDYVESRLYNPSFAFGLEGWTLRHADGTAVAAETALDLAADRDPLLRLEAGQVLSQAFGTERGRLPRRDTRPDQACVDATSTNGATLRLQSGAGEPAMITLAPDHAGRACTAIDSHPIDERLEFRIAIERGEVTLRGTWLFDHVQDGGMRTLDNGPGRHLDAFVAFNAAMMRSELPEDCRR
ncbi:MAG: hypothetical protein ACRC2H_01425 [Silanimonas sp.]